MEFEYTQAGRTNLFHASNNSLLELEGRLYQVKSNGIEPPYEGYTVSVETYQFKGDDTKDAAQATVLPNTATPPQLVLREGSIIDYPFEGSGKFFCLSPDGDLQTFIYDDSYPLLSSLKITYNKGHYQFWQAGERGLKFMEICIPPYQVGDLINLDIHSPDVPEVFRKIYIMAVVEGNPGDTYVEGLRAIAQSRKVSFADAYKIAEADALITKGGEHIISLRQALRYLESQ